MSMTGMFEHWGIYKTFISYWNAWTVSGYGHENSYHAGKCNPWSHGHGFHYSNGHDEIRTLIQYINNYLIRH